MELCGVYFVLAAAGILLQASGGSAAPMQCHFDSRGEDTTSFLGVVLPKTCFSYIPVCHFSRVCIWRKTLFNGWNLDGQHMYAVHLPAPSWCGLLWDVCIWSTFFCHCTSVSCNIFNTDGSVKLSATTFDSLNKTENCSNTNNNGRISLLLQCNVESVLVSSTLINSPGCIGQWISLHGVRCEWNQLPARFRWCRWLILVSPASKMRTGWTQAMDHWACSNILSKD